MANMDKPAHGAAQDNKPQAGKVDADKVMPRQSASGAARDAQDSGPGQRQMAGSPNKQGGNQMSGAQSKQNKPSDQQPAANKGNDRQMEQYVSDRDQQRLSGNTGSEQHASRGGTDGDGDKDPNSNQPSRTGKGR